MHGLMKIPCLIFTCWEKEKTKEEMYLLCYSFCKGPNESRQKGELLIGD